MYTMVLTQDIAQEYLSLVSCTAICQTSTYHRSVIGMIVLITLDFPRKNIVFVKSIAHCPRHVEVPSYPAEKKGIGQILYPNKRE